MGAKEAWEFIAQMFEKAENVQRDPKKKASAKAAKEAAKKNAKKIKNGD